MNTKDLIEKIRNELALMCFCKSSYCNRCTFSENKECKNEPIRKNVFKLVTKLESKLQSLESSQPKAKPDKLK